MSLIANSKKLSLREVGRVTGYASDYLGFLIRKKKIRGKKIKKIFSWLVPKNELKKILQNTKNLANRDSSFLLRGEYFTLKDAAKLTGYSAAYIGWLIRKNKIKGKKKYNISWATNENAIKYYHIKKSRKESFLVKIIYSIKNNFDFSLGVQIHGLISAIFGFF